VRVFTLKTIPVAILTFLVGLRRRDMSKILRNILRVAGYQDKNILLLVNDMSVSTIFLIEIRVVHIQKNTIKRIVINIKNIVVLIEYEKRLREPQRKRLYLRRLLMII